jgi:aminopeptidase N
LIAAPFERYEKPIQNGQAQVYLRSSDPDLAERYLEATERYLALYSALIGPYPYDKFAPVENFWDTGLGMPSFTLLGPRVIRLPFILYTSYPHEVLHNWWGNGVYVDYETGNWSEGLTAYLADNLADFFRHWTERTGAPELALTDVRVEHATDGQVLRGRLEQIQAEEPFPMQVPLVVHLEDGSILEHKVPLSDRSADFELKLPLAPIRVDADPRFDLFRILASGETPTTLSALFGSERGLILLPADAPADLAE